MIRRGRRTAQAEPETSVGDPATAYFAYWSIYTDLKRIPFRELYWPRLKAIIGPSAKLLRRIEREENYHLRRPMRELRCHAYSYFRAGRPADALAHVVRTASRLGALWQVMHAGLDVEHDPLVELVWDRHNTNRPGFEPSPAALPMLIDVMVSLRVDEGEWLGGGYIRLPKHNQARPEPRPQIEMGAGLGTGHFEAVWQVETQTSTKRELIEEHWPRLQATFVGAPCVMVDLEKRSGDVGPFRYRVRQAFNVPTAADVLAACLPRCRPSMHVRLSFAPDGTLTLLSGRTPRPDTTRPTRLLGLELRRAEIAAQS